MRRLLLSTVMAASYGAAAMAQSCARPAELQAFHIIGLKSSLMVGALACSQRDQYDAFMTQFQPHILTEQHVMDSYFRRTGGGQAREDDYVTLLANSQSQSGISQGAAFCQADAAVFKQVLALKTSEDLDSFSTANPSTQPVAFSACTIHSYVHYAHYSHHVTHHTVKTLTIADKQ